METQVTKLSPTPVVYATHIPGTNIIKLSPADALDTTENSTIRSDSNNDDTMKPAGQNNGDGGNTMDERFATKEELKTLETKMDGRFDTMIAKLDGQFNVLNQSVNGLKESIPDKISIAITKEFNERDKERKETNHFIIGTIVIGSLSLIVGIISVAVSLWH